mmetsp:Transcript_11313/g.35748  ORF Transcript_11313/g.35748 Transcript_11313/m.35748 type:complete len:293 (+) Transcript_11313:1393-2271(+)
MGTAGLSDSDRGGRPGVATSAGPRVAHAADADRLPQALCTCGAATAARRQNTKSSASNERPHGAASESDSAPLGHSPTVVGSAAVLSAASRPSSPTAAARAAAMALVCGGGGASEAPAAAHGAPAPSSTALAPAPSAPAAPGARVRCGGSGGSGPRSRSRLRSACFTLVAPLLPALRGDFSATARSIHAVFSHSGIARHCRPSSLAMSPKAMPGLASLTRCRFARPNTVKPSAPTGRQERFSPGAPGAPFFLNLRTDTATACVTAPSGSLLAARSTCSNSTFDCLCPSGPFQ